MSPILVRPVREQLEHDRVIRLLQAKFRRRYEVAINPGDERNAAIGSGAAAMYPDVLLLSTGKGRRPQALIEVETAESVNNLEAMAQWDRLTRFRAPVHLYLPASAVDTARRLCADNNIPIAEIWTFHTIGDQVRFTLVHRMPAEDRSAARSSAARSRSGSPARGRKSTRRAARKPARRARPRRAASSPRPSRTRK